VLWSSLITRYKTESATLKPDERLVAHNFFAAMRLHLFAESLDKTEEGDLPGLILALS